MGRDAVPLPIGDGAGGARREQTAEEYARAICAMVGERLPQDGAVDSETDKHIGTILALLPDLVHLGDRQGLAIAELALRALTANPPRIEIAVGVMRGLTAVTGSGTIPIRRLSGARLVCAGITLFVGAIWFAATFLLSVIGYDVWAQATKGSELAAFVLAALVGGVGSAASTLLRLQDFEALRVTDKVVPITIGFVRPVIGVCFGIFVFLAYTSGIITIGVAQQSKQIFVVLTFAFIAGFSERFVPDLVTRISGQVASPSRDERRRG